MRTCVSGFESVERFTAWSGLFFIRQLSPVAAASSVHALSTLTAAMEFIIEIFKSTWEKLTGIDRLILAAVTVIVVIGWVWLGAKKTEQKQFKRRLVFLSLMLIVAAIGIAIHHLVPPKQFPSNVAGVLVLSIEGDDSAGSLQRELVSSLDAELAKDTTGENIKIWATDDIVDKKQGLDVAHTKARRIGEKRKALLVIWGSKSKAGETEFFPCITLLRTNKNLGLASERTLAVQDIHEVSLPAEIVRQPIYLAHFVAGYSFYDRKQYQEAINHFEAALHSSLATQKEAADLRFFLGFCHLNFAQGQPDMRAHAQLAIDDLSFAARYYQQSDNLEKYAITLNDLGVAYWRLPTGDRGENL